ncbi:hypothetical protein EJD97_013728, partial [Solanum chilense]
ITLVILFIQVPLRCTAICGKSIAVKTIDSTEDYAKLYNSEIVRFHGVLSSIISDRDVRRRELEFKVHDWVFLKVSPMKGVMRFGMKWTISPRYVGPYNILKSVFKSAYELELQAELAPAYLVRMYRKKEVISVKMLWRNQFVEGATWEAETPMKPKYPHLFSSVPTPT